MDLLSAAGLVMFGSLIAPGAPAISKDPGIHRVAITCFLKGEQVSGMNKICYYDCLGSAAAITISAVQLCPLNVQR
jgi:hypothetical protein